MQTKFNKLAFHFRYMFHLLNVSLMDSQSGSFADAMENWQNGIEWKFWMLWLVSEHWTEFRFSVHPTQGKCWHLTYPELLHALSAAETCEPRVSINAVLVNEWWLVRRLTV